MSQLTLNRRTVNAQSTDANGVWHCRLNAWGLRDRYTNGYDEQVNVGIYSRGMSNWHT